IGKKPTNKKNIPPIDANLPKGPDFSTAKLASVYYAPYPAGPNLAEPLQLKITLPPGDYIVIAQAFVQNEGSNLQNFVFALSFYPPDNFTNVGLRGQETFNVLSSFAFSAAKPESVVFHLAGVGTLTSASGIKIDSDPCGVSDRPAFS